MNDETKNEISAEQVGIGAANETAQAIALLVNDPRFIAFLEREMNADPDLTVFGGVQKLFNTALAVERGRAKGCDALCLSVRRSIRERIAEHCAANGVDVAEFMARAIAAALDVDVQVLS